MVPVVVAGCSHGLLLVELCVLVVWMHLGAAAMSREGLWCLWLPCVCAYGAGAARAAAAGACHSWWQAAAMGSCWLSSVLVVWMHLRAAAMSREGLWCLWLWQAAAMGSCWWSCVCWWCGCIWGQLP